MTRDFEKLILQGYSATDNAQAILENELGIIYRDAYDQAAKELGELYLKLGDKIDLPEARKYRRLETLMKSLSDAYRELTGQSVKLTGNNSYQAYMDAFHRTTWSFEQTLFDGYQLDVSKISKELSWGVIPTDAIIASVMSENSGLNYIKTFSKNMEGQLWKIQSAITRGIANGHSYKKTAKSLEDVFNGGFSDAMRVVRTEAGRNYSEGNLQATSKAESAGIKLKKRWVSTLDGRTRHDHAVADGQIADKDGNFHVGGASGPAPGLLDQLDQIVNCRCRYINELDGYPPELRRIGEDIEPYQTFATWAKPLEWTEANGWPKLKM